MDILILNLITFQSSYIFLSEWFNINVERTEVKKAKQMMWLPRKSHKKYNICKVSLSNFNRK